MAIPFLNNISLNNNEIQNVKLHNTGNIPSPSAGHIYFDTDDNIAKYWNGTAWVDIVASTGGTVTSVTSGNTNTITVGGTATDPTISANTAAVANGSLNLATGDQIYDFVIGQGYVESVGSNNSTFVNLVDSGTATDPNLTASLSATGTASSSTFLRGDNTWATPINTNTTYDLDSIQVGSDVAITLVGSDATVDTVTLVAGTNITLTDNGSKNITIDVADGVLDVANFNASAIVTAAEGIENNDNDTTLPTSASVKAYVDASVVGGLVYQGGYNASTNTPDLTTSPNSIKKGWTYTVTADGTFFGIQLRSGDVLIAEIDNPLAGVDWTIVEKNTDYASASTIGIGNVTAGTGVSVSYNGTGTATITNADTNASNTTTGTITAGNTSGTVTHNWGTLNTIVQTIDSSGDTVFCDISRTTNTVVAAIAGAQVGDITILVQKIG